jgi:nitrite reductase/ring-hydroxylating ferredoxin subunit
MKAPLGGLDSFVRGKTVTCNRHGWRYDIPSGNCLTHDWAKLKTYQIKIEGDYIWVGYTTEALEVISDEE